jgi:hypothetical protein
MLHGLSETLCAPRLPAAITAPVAIGLALRSFFELKMALSTVRLPISS